MTDDWKDVDLYEKLEARLQSLPTLQTPLDEMDEWEVVEAMKAVLEMGPMVGLDDPDLATLWFARKLEAEGWSFDRAMQLRDTAARMSFWDQM